MLAGHCGAPAAFSPPSRLCLPITSPLWSIAVYRKSTFAVRDRWSSASSDGGRFRKGRRRNWRKGKVLLPAAGDRRILELMEFGVVTLLPDCQPSRLILAARRNRGKSQNSPPGAARVGFGVEDLSEMGKGGVCFCSWRRCPILYHLEQRASLPLPLQLL